MRRKSELKIYDNKATESKSTTTKRTENIDYVVGGNFKIDGDIQTENKKGWSQNPPIKDGEKTYNKIAEFITILAIIIPATFLLNVQGNMTYNFAMRRKSELKIYDNKATEVVLLRVC